MPKTLKGMPQHMLDAMDRQGYEKYMTQGVNRHRSLCLGNFFNEEDLSAILDTDALIAFGGSIDRFNDLPATVTILYCMGKSGKSLSDLEGLPQDELRNMGHEMLLDLQKSQFKIDAATPGFQNFFKTIMDGMEKFLDEPFPDVDFQNLSNLTTEQKKHINTLSRISFGLGANLIPDLMNIPNARFLVETVGEDRLNDLALSNNAANLNLAALSQTFMKPEEGKDNHYYKIAAKRKVIQENASIFEKFAQGKIKDVKNHGDDIFFGHCITDNVDMEIANYQMENDVGEKTRDAIKTDPEYDWFVKDVDLSYIDDFEFDPATDLEIAKEQFSRYNFDVAARATIQEEVNNNTYENLIENHRFDMVFDANGLPHTMDYVETLHATEPFYMAKDGVVHEYHLVDRDGKAYVEQTDTPATEPGMYDLDVVRDIVDNMMQELNDADPKTLLSGSKEFKAVKDSMKDLQESLKGDLKTADKQKLEYKIGAAFRKTQDYIVYRTTGEGKNKRMSDTAKKRIAAVKACGHSLHSMAKVVKGRDVTNDVKSFRKTELYLQEAKLRNGDSDAKIVFDAVNHLKGLAAMSPEKRQAALQDMFITKADKVEFAKTLPQDQVKTNPRLNAPTLSDEIAMFTVAKIYEKKFPDVQNDLREGAFRKLLSDTKTRGLINDYITMHFGEEIKRGDFSNVMKLVTEEKSMNQMLLGVKDMNQPQNARVEKVAPNREVSSIQPGL